MTLLRNHVLHANARLIVGSVWLWGMLGGVPSGRQVGQQGNVEHRMDAIAAHLAEYIELRGGDDALSMGRFDCPPQLNAAAGPGMAKLLSESLARRGVAVRRVGELGVRGSYVLLEHDPENGDPAAEVSAELVDRGGKVLRRAVERIQDEQSMAELFGATAELQPEAPEGERLQVLFERIVEPRADVRTHRIAASPESPFALEILKAEGEGYDVIAPESEGGIPFVPIDRDDLYAVRLINDSAMDAAVTLTIDGLNMFAFSDNSSYRYVIVPAEGAGVIKGWHRSNERSDAFKVTSYAETAVAELGADDAGMGVITASFKAAWPKAEPAPIDERMLFARRGQVGTGRGPSVAQNYDVVERVVGSLRATVSVRYTRD